MEIEKVTSEGFGVRLEPLEERRHRAQLASAIEDGELWSLAVTSIPRPQDLGKFFAAAVTGREMAFGSIDQRSGRVVGSTRFCNIDVPHRRLEIGFTFLAPPTSVPMLTPPRSCSCWSTRSNAGT